MTEEVMLQGCLDNLSSAQGVLYNLYSPRMLGVCYRYARSREDAEDMLQDGFIKVYSQIHQFKGDGSLEGWIRKIVIHTCINALKKNKKFSDSVDLAFASTIQVNDNNISSMLQAKQVVECIRLLPIGYRTVLNLYAIEGFSHREISSILEIEESTSRSQYTRAKSMLEEILIKKKILQKPRENVRMVSVTN
ncbi:MAG TPA: sigma-70 family RNA polymerase sigma factor [Hanamia sp.]|nr:sigma-70 family RNA polymerase sigma factor [Hanamia sp.]